MSAMFLRYRNGLLYFLTCKHWLGTCWFLFALAEKVHGLGGEIDDGRTSVHACSG